MKLNRLIDPRFKKVVVALQGELIPLKGAYQLKGIVEAIDKELVKYEELRKGALDRFGKRDDKGEFVVDENSNIQFDDDKKAEFAKELGELLDTEVSIPKMKVSDLGDKLSLTVQDLFQVEDILDN